MRAMVRRRHDTILAVQLISAAALAALPAHAQNGYSFLNAAESKAPYTDASVRPQSSCAALVSLTNYEFSIVSAQLVAANADAPEHCRVSGVIPP